MVNVIGYSADTGEMFGIAFDKRSFMSSSDNGHTWNYIAYSRFQVCSQFSCSVVSESRLNIRFYFLGL